LYASAVFDQQRNEIILKMVNATNLVKNQPVTLNVKKRLDAKASLMVLKSDSPDAVNSLEHPKLVSPEEQSFVVKGKTVETMLAPNSFSVYKIKMLE
jgi:alpha-L-arabinofuranosidase